jgi:hypothetical protein
VIVIIVTIIIIIILIIIIIVGIMLPCPVGTYREAVTNVSVIALEQAAQCTDCPYGRYRPLNKGKSADDCSKCPLGTYANVTGIDDISVVVVRQ